MTNEISKRQSKEKELILEQLRKTPIIQISCERTGVARATYYRWRKDPIFLRRANEALNDGMNLVNDLAESQLISSIKDKNMTGIIFWLKSHHPDYANKLELTGKLQHDFEITPEQEAIISKALKMVVGKEKHGKR